MKLKVVPESLLERLALWLGLVPVALLDTHVAATLARTVTAGVKLGVFEALASTPLTASEVAARRGLDPAASGLLLNALAACGYLSVSDGRYALTRQSRKWLLAASPKSVRDKLLLQVVEWDWLAQLEQFVSTGRPIEFHTAMSDADRDLYHRSMRALASVSGWEVGRRIPAPRGATRMLDLGGSHGHYAAELCRRHPALRAEVLDLPEAVARAAPLLAAEGLGDRVVHVRGSVLDADLGNARYDLILMSNLAHHLSFEENQALTVRVARALRPGGVFVIQEAVLPPASGSGAQIGTLLGLYFALQSRPDVRTWTVAEMAGWQRAAGLTPARAIRLRTAPGWVQQAGRR